MRSKFYFTLAMGTVLLAACQKDDLGIREQEVFTSAYNREFTNTFGDVDPNQNWDATTRAMTEYKSVKSEDGYYYVEDATLSWFKNYMEEGENNSSKVKSFTLTTTEATTFEIVPLYQGGAYYDWTVEMMVISGNQTYSAWSWDKGDGTIEAKDRVFDHWSGTLLNPVPVYKESDWWTVTAGDGDHSETTDAIKTRSKTTKVDIPANSTIYFRITNKDKNKNGNYTGGTRKGQKNNSPYTSIQNPTYIGALTTGNGTNDLKVPTNVSSVNPDYSAMIITCEGYYNQGSAPDFNEAAFLLVGYVPQAIVEDSEVTTTSTKRYMMEDFGSIDWDFNDVVVDVTTTTVARYKINTETGATTPVGTPRVSHTAKIAHLGGTYPVQVKVGNTLLPKISDPLNQQQTEAQLAGTFDGTATYGHNGTSNPGWEPTAAAVTVEGFDPDDNNVSITVWKDYNPGTEANTDDVWTTSFPEAGAKPFIIAVRSYDRWTAEGVSVKTASWWNDLWGTSTQP